MLQTYVFAAPMPDPTFVARICEKVDWLLFNRRGQRQHTRVSTPGRPLTAASQPESDPISLSLVEPGLEQLMYLVHLYIWVLFIVRTQVLQLGLQFRRLNGDSSTVFIGVGGKGSVYAWRCRLCGFGTIIQRSRELVVTWRGGKHLAERHGDTWHWTGWPGSSETERGRDAVSEWWKVVLCPYSRG